MNAIIKINSDISQEVANRICEDFMLAVKDPEVKQIIFWISSGGGKTAIVPTLDELIKMSHKPVCAIATSIVASTAASIFMMAPRRILLPNTRFLLHKSSCSLNGSFTADALKEAYEESKKMDKVFFSPVLANSKIPEKVLYKKTQNRDWILTEKELIKYGIITEMYNIEEVKKLTIED